MRFNKLDLNQLVVLDAILSEGSVKKAAERLYLSPPATSCALARLREFFEDDLLLQVGRTMVLTPKAESLVRPVRDVLLQIHAITTSSPVFDPMTSTRKFTIESSDYVMNVFLGEVIQRAAHEAPGMQFDLRLLGEHTQSDFESGEVDLMVVPEFMTVSEHPSMHLFEDSWSCIMWIGSTAHQQDTMTLAQYLSMEHVVCEWGAGRLISSDERIVQKHGYARRRSVTAPNFMCVPQLLVGTYRIATLQTRLARRLALAAPLRVVPCPLPMPPLVEMAQWHKHHDRDLALLWVRELMKRTAIKFEDSGAPQSAAKPASRRALKPAIKPPRLPQR